MSEDEEKIEYKHPDDISTNVEGADQDCRQSLQESKAEKKVVRKIDLAFLPLVICIVTVQARQPKFCTWLYRRVLQQQCINRGVLLIF